MVRLRFETDLATSLKASADLAKATDKIGAGYKVAAKEATALEKAAKRITDQNLTPQERYNQKLETMAKAVKAGSLSMADAERNAGRMRATMDRAFGPQAMSNVTSFLSRFVGPGALLGLATLGIQNFRAEVNKVRDMQKSNFTGPGQLAQLAITEKNPQKAFDSMMREARSIRSTGAAANDDEGANLLFALRSAKFDRKDRKFFAKAKASGLITDTEPFIAAVNAIRKSFPELSAQQVFSMGLVAAGPSPGTASGLTATAGKSGAALKQLGYTPGFGLASTGILSEVYGQAEAGTRMEQFLKQFEKYGLKEDPTLAGLEGPEVIKRIGDKGLGRENLIKYVGDRTEAMQAVRTLHNNLDQLQTLTKETEAAAGGNLAAQALTLPTSDPELAASLAARSSQGRRDRSLAKPATSMNILESIYNDRTASKREGKPGFGTETRNAIDTLELFFSGLNREEAREKQIRRLSGTPGLSDTTQQAIELYLRRTAESNERMERQSLQAPRPSGRQQ